MQSSRGHCLPQTAKHSGYHAGPIHISSPQSPPFCHQVNFGECHGSNPLHIPKDIATARANVDVIYQLMNQFDGIKGMEVIGNQNDDLLTRVALLLTAFPYSKYHCISEVLGRLQKALTSDFDMDELDER
jgi:hypothetical protein